MPWRYFLSLFFASSHLSDYVDTLQFSPPIFPSEISEYHVILILDFDSYINTNPSPQLIDNRSQPCDTSLPAIVSNAAIIINQYVEFRSEIVTDP